MHTRNASDFIPEISSDDPRIGGELLRQVHPVLEEDICRVILGVPQTFAITGAATPAGCAGLRNGDDSLISLPEATQIFL